VNRLPLGRAPTLALVHAIALVAGTAARADDVEAPEAPPRVLLSSSVAGLSSGKADDFASSFGIRKGVGIQVVKPVEVNDHQYEIHLAGPLVKSGSKKKSLGLKFELRF